MFKSLQRSFQSSKHRLMMLGGLTAITILLIGWMISTYPYLLENPSWLFSRPSNEIIIKTLPSTKNVDYRPLRALLETQQWEKADRETKKNIGRLLGFVYPIFINLRLPRATEISKISCTDLLTMDRLWIKFSDGRFGYSIQRQIVESDNRLSSPEEIRQLCLRQCSLEVPRTIQTDRCKLGCASQRIDAELKRIPEAMGRGHSTVGTPLPAGYYPSPGELFLDHEAEIYHEFAKRAARCRI